MKSNGMVWALMRILISDTYVYVYACGIKSKWLALVAGLIASCVLQSRQLTCQRQCPILCSSPRLVFAGRAPSKLGQVLSSTSCVGIAADMRTCGCVDCCLSTCCCTQQHVLYLHDVR